jgi:hypothetical protein
VAEATAQALAAAGHREPSTQPMVRDAVAAQTARARRSLQVLAALNGATGVAPLVDALRDEVTSAGRRAGVLLSLAHDPQVITAGLAGLASPSEHDRNTSLEMLEVTVGRPLARALVAVASPDLDDLARMELLTESGPAEPEPRGGWVRALALDEDGYWREPWLRACALHAAATTAPAEAREIAERFVGDADPAVAETASWVVAGGAR